MYCYVQEAAQFANVFISGSVTDPAQNKIVTFWPPIFRTVISSVGDRDRDPYCIWIRRIRMFLGLADPCPILICRIRMYLGLPDLHPDPFSHVYGSGSGCGSGSFHHQAKKVKKDLNFFCFVTSYDFLPVIRIRIRMLLGIPDRAC